jgi:neutral ceramidase
MSRSCVVWLAFLTAFPATNDRTARAAGDGWKAGVGTSVITPTEPVWLSGYSSRTAPAEGKVHDLFAKAVCLEDSRGTRLVLVTLDLGSIGTAITEAVARRVEETHKIPRAALILNVSHTHCAPEVAAERRVFHELADAEEAKLVRYIAWLEDRIVEAIDQAVRDLSPAKLSVSRSRAEFGFSRRIPVAGGGITAGQNPEGVVDRDVPVMRVTGVNGEIRAILFGYACHNTTLAFQLYCGDYAGFAQEALEKAYPGAKALFVMGCGGDMNPFPRHGALGLDHARTHGQALAAAVTRALMAEQHDVKGLLSVTFETVTLDLEPLPPRARLEADAGQGTKTHAGRKALYLLDRLKREGEIPLEQACPLHVARFGDDLLFVAISGETTVDYSLLCKREFEGRFVWVAGYNDDVFAYLPSLRVLREGGYEGRDGIIHQLTPTPFAPSVEDRVMGSIRRLVQEARAGANRR